MQDISTANLKHQQAKRFDRRDVLYLKAAKLLIIKDYRTSSTIYFIWTNSGIHFDELVEVKSTSSTYNNHYITIAIQHHGLFPNGRVIELRHIPTPMYLLVCMATRINTFFFLSFLPALLQFLLVGIS